jgi:hypothetical protein
MSNQAWQSKLSMQEIRESDEFKESASPAAAVDFGHSHALSWK